MSCATCGHTMAEIGDRAAREVWLCPRCGTVKVRTYTGDPNAWREDTYVPKLVERCREFERPLFDPGAPDPKASEWHALGIGEAINLPDARPWN